MLVGKGVLVGAGVAPASGGPDGANDWLLFTGWSGHSTIRVVMKAVSRWSGAKARTTMLCPTLVPEGTWLIANSNIPSEGDVTGA